MKEKYPSQYMFCDGVDCPNDIGFTSKFGKKHYDDGVYNIGYHYYCKKCSKKAKFLHPQVTKK